MLTNCLAACAHLSSTVSQLFEPQVQKIAIFTYRSPHFCFPWRCPCDYHALCCMDGKTINACQTPRSMYLSVFNSFRVIRCLSQYQKSLFLPHFCFPWGRPWGNHVKCCMDGKWIRCLQIVPLHVPIYLLPFMRYSEIFVKKSSFYHTPLHSTPPLGGFPSEYRHHLWNGKTRIVSLPDGEKISKISLFVLTWSTNVTDGRTDRQTDRHCVTA